MDLGSHASHLHNRTGLEIPSCSPRWRMVIRQMLWRSRNSIEDVLDSTRGDLMFVRALVTGREPWQEVA